jgi:phytoene/squalene synthetase
MELEKAFAACAATVRRHDPDRYFSALFAPAEKRPLLLTLYAFNHEVARIAEIVREPMMGEIRLQWWRETVDGARAATPRAHDVARALAGIFARTDLPPDLFDAMLDARALDFSNETFADDTARDTYLDATSGNLIRLAARVLGAGADCDSLAGEAGIAYGLAGLLRSQAFHGARGKRFLVNIETTAAEALRRIVRARALPRPGVALPAFLPAALVPLYLKHGERDVPLYRKQLALLSASLRGRI